MPGRLRAGVTGTDSQSRKTSAPAPRSVTSDRLLRPPAATGSTIMSTNSCALAAPGRRFPGGTGSDLCGAGTVEADRTSPSVSPAK